jgi:2-polyprenyl-3-methyl-5-hydroxy-6-metoxy-1,4-benzoquinol methylase
MTADPHPTAWKTYSELALEWDRVAARRDNDIATGKDITYTRLLTPAILEMQKQWEGLHVLDVGCGSGHLAAQIAERGATVLGIDISNESIGLALSKSNDRLSFSCVSVESYSVQNLPGRFDVAIANMTLQTTPNLNECVIAIGEQLKPDGELITTFPHPCFWPAYWKYDKEPWFRYVDEIPIEATFRTSLVPDGVGVTTHFHRPLSRYIAAFTEAGLSLTMFSELTPDDSLSNIYPVLWPYPRFVALKLRRLESRTMIQPCPSGASDAR